MVVVHKACPAPWPAVGDIFCLSVIYMVPNIASVLCVLLFLCPVSWNKVRNIVKVVGFILLFK